MTSPWTSLWILEFLRCEKKSGCPFQKLAEEANKLDSLNDLKNALVNICLLIDKKQNDAPLGQTNAAACPSQSFGVSRKRRRPSQEGEEGAPISSVTFSPTTDDEPKRLRATIAVTPGVAAGVNFSLLASKDEREKENTQQGQMESAGPRGRDPDPWTRGRDDERLPTNSLRISDRLVHRSVDDSSSKLVVLCSQDTTAPFLQSTLLAPNSVDSGEQQDEIVSAEPLTSQIISENWLALKQLSLACELCKLARLMCQLASNSTCGLSESLDIDIKQYSMNKLTLVARIFVGILMTQNFAVWTDQLPTCDEFSTSVRQKVLPILRHHQQAIDRSLIDGHMATQVRDSLSPEGLEDLRALSHKLCKLYSLFSDKCKSRAQEISTFARINPEETTPSRRAVLEHAADLRRNLTRICDYDISKFPEGVDAIERILTLTLNGTIDLNAYADMIRENELSMVWLATSSLKYKAETESILESMKPHLKRYQEKVEDANQRILKAEHQAKQKELERREAASQKLINIKPVLNYLQWSERCAQESIRLAGGILNPCIVLGIPYASISKSILKKLKLKVQANLHPDKYNLEWISEEEREEMSQKIPHAFRLVTEALNELQKLDGTAAKWLGQGPTKAPPYAEEIGLNWATPEIPGRRGSTRTADSRRRSCPPPETPVKRSPPRTETPAAKPASTSRDAFAIPQLTPLTVRSGGVAILKDCIYNQCTQRRSALDESDIMSSTLEGFDRVEHLTCRQGTCELRANFKTNSQTTDNRLLYVWLAAPKFRDCGHTFRSRVIMQYAFPLACRSAESIRLVLENVPLIGTARFIKFEIMAAEILTPNVTTPTARHVGNQHTDIIHFEQSIEVPTHREGGVNLYRNSLSALYGLTQSDISYAKALPAFVFNVESHGGANYLRGLRRSEARQLLESANNDLDSMLLASN